MRRNVMQDVKHFEDSEQFFLSIGKCFVIEALMEFFGMADEGGNTTKKQSKLCLSHNCITAGAILDNKT